ncbi:MAG: filamentous hemagglutinin N-terminal domain-containing protein, partial [Candidatus Methylumidiphilus sp.]
MKKFQHNKICCALLIALNLAAGAARAAPPVGATPGGVGGNLTLDNTLGNPAGSIAKTPANVYNVDAAASGVFSGGGRNVFFSFSQFRIDRNESAVFQCPTCGTAGNPAIPSNVISRVNNNPVEIYGNLTSTIGSANFYLLSNEGVIVGKNASLNLPGALHLGATNVLGFSGGGQLNPATADVSTLDANPNAFGFLSGAGTGKIVLGAEDQSAGQPNVITITTGTGPAPASGDVEISAGNPDAGGPSLEVRGAATVNAQTNGGAVALRSGAADSGVSAITLRNGVLVNVAGGGAATVETDNAAGSVTVETGATLNNTAALRSASTLTVAGAANAATTTAGGDLNVSGTLNADSVSATGRITVTGLVQKTGAGDLAVTGGAIQVDGAAGRITSSADGALTVRATAADPAGGAALRVSNGGQINGGNTQNMTVLAEQGTVDVDGAGSRISGGNTGRLDVGFDAANTSNLVRVRNGGAIEKTAGAGLTVRGRAVLVENANSQIRTAAGSSGAFLVEVTGADGLVADPANAAATLDALTLRDNGRIIGSQNGDMNVLASAAVGAGTVRVGRFNSAVDQSAGLIAKTIDTTGNLSVTGGQVAVEGAGSRILMGAAAADPTLPGVVNNPMGRLAVTATAADPSATQTALRVGNGGQVIANNLRIADGSDSVLGSLHIISEQGALQLDAAWLPPTCFPLPWQVVGSIVWTASVGQAVRKGEELGYFAFGGSTIVTLFQPEKVCWDEDLV